MLSFEAVVLVILGIVAGAELVNVFMLGTSDEIGGFPAWLPSQERNKQDHVASNPRPPKVVALLRPLPAGE